jgi:hypothetical protein
MMLVTFSLLFMMALLAAVPALSNAAAQRGEFMIVNRSNYTIYQLFLSPSNRVRWGPDQLRRRVIKPGDSYTLNGIPCGLYDVKVVDHDGDACVVREIPMCKDHTHWEMTNDSLLRCEGFSD